MQSLHPKSEWIWRAIVAFFAVFVGSKILLQLLKTGADNLISQGKKKDQEDLDQKIETMVDKINRGEFGPASSVIQKAKSPGNPSAGQIKGNILEQCLVEYEEKIKASPDSKETQELKEVMPLIQDARWGSGKSWLQLTKDLAQNLKIPEARVNLGPLMMDVIREKHYCRQGVLLGAKDLMNTIKNHFVFETLFSESTDLSKESCLLPTLSKQTGLDLQLLAKGFELYAAKLAGKSKEELFNMILAEASHTSFLKSIDSAQKKRLLEKAIFAQASGPPKIVHFSEMLHEVKKKAELVLEAGGLYKLGERGDPRFGPEELREAYQLLGASMRDPEEEVKRAFNQLAKRAHPDRMATMNVSDEKMKGVNQKFAELKNAYDLIKVWLKRKKKFMDRL